MVNANKASQRLPRLAFQAGFRPRGGWLLTDHHVTRVEVGATTNGNAYSPVPLFVAKTRRWYVPVHNQFSTRGSA